MEKTSYSVIFDHVLFESKIEEVRLLSLSLNESIINSSFENKYPKQFFAPIEEYLNEAFLKGLMTKGKNFLQNFTKGAKEIATKISSSIKEFSFKKVFATVSKMMHKIKSKMLKSLMILLSPLRETILKYSFCTEDNKFLVGAAFKKLVSIAKEVGKEDGAEEILSEPVVLAIRKNANLEGTGELRENDEFVDFSYNVLQEGEAEERKKGTATFDKKDVKYLDFFQKILFKLGVRNTKLNGFLSEIVKKITTGAAIVGISAIIVALLPTSGVLTAIGASVGAATAAAGAAISGAVAAAPALVMIVGAILFGIGLFMFATWLLKPYPTIENCRIFLGTIFSGAHPFDFPESSLDTIAVSVKKPKNAKKIKPPFNIELIVDLEEEGVEEDIPTNDKKDDVSDIKKFIKDYEDIDVDILEDEYEINKHNTLCRKFVRNVFTQKGTETMKEELINIEEDEEDDDYTKELDKLLTVIDYIYDSALVKEEDEDGKKKYPFGLNYKKIQTFLRDKNNSVLDRLSKVIDCVDNFVDRVEKDFLSDKTTTKSKKIETANVGRN